MKVANCVQGTRDWFDCRNGRVTASRINHVMNWLKNGNEGQKRIDYRTELIAEMLTGQAMPHVVTEAMKWGVEQEMLAATEYVLGTDEQVSSIGFVYHPSIERAGASPDRLVGKDGLLEVKCPTTTTHIEWALAGVVPEEHRKQMFFQMRCCERDWCDFVSFDSRLPKRYQLFTKRLHADEAIMDEVDSEVLQFLGEVDAIIACLNQAMPEIIEVPKEAQMVIGMLTDADFIGLL